MTHHAGRVEEASSFACASVQPCQLLDQKNVARSQVRRAGFCVKRGRSAFWIVRSTCLARPFSFATQDIISLVGNFHWNLPKAIALALANRNFH